MWNNVCIPTINYRKSEVETDCRDSKVQNSESSLFFFFCWSLYGLVVWLGLGDLFISQNSRGVCASHSPGQQLSCAYTICSNGQISISFKIPSGSLCQNQSYLVLYSFCANLLHSFIMWVIVSFLSPHSLHLLFSCDLSILALIWLVLMALFWAAIRRNSISLLRSPPFFIIVSFSH